PPKSPFSPIAHGEIAPWEIGLTSRWNDGINTASAISSDGCPFSLGAFFKPASSSVVAYRMHRRLEAAAPFRLAEITERPAIAKPPLGSMRLAKYRTTIRGLDLSRSFKVPGSRLALRTS